MPEVLSPESYASIQELARDAQRDLQAAQDQLKVKAREVRLKLWAVSDAESDAKRLIADAERAHLNAKQDFRAYQAHAEKMADRVHKLNDLIRQNNIDQHPHKASALNWAEAHPEYTLDLTQSYKVLVNRAGRYIGEVSCIRPHVDTWTFLFAPYRCVEMKAIGPFEYLEDALDAATTVTPYEPDIHTDAAFGAGVADKAFLPPVYSPTFEQAGIDNNNAACAVAEGA
ncbi:hypothetical protein CcrColossus_gp050 [Caulobacter phage CcrColossus]|uniref:Uncharacterized protein n=1 Tax=Caulobacter phage CcrColossus TaxID=1211640 RepID=K4JUC0_9CAUD|nr:hypothetical protein CcrColossus_gp050 [Caulobacter phage CcrColossus]AFU87920.1 hypothetical protein CcrColossus_gp050 [Caulobacter phage CcrColossus]